LISPTKHPSTKLHRQTQSQPAVCHPRTSPNHRTHVEPRSTTITQFRLLPLNSPHPESQFPIPSPPWPTRKTLDRLRCILSWWKAYVVVDGHPSRFTLAIHSDFIITRNHRCPSPESALPIQVLHEGWGGICKTDTFPGERPALPSLPLSLQPPAHGFCPSRTPTSTAHR
jgi:hypothetical protein